MQENDSKVSTSFPFQGLRILGAKFNQSDSKRRTNKERTEFVLTKYLPHGCRVPWAVPWLAFRRSFANGSWTMNLGMVKRLQGAEYQQELANETNIKQSVETNFVFGKGPDEVDQRSLHMCWDVT